MKNAFEKNVKIAVERLIEKGKQILLLDEAQYFADIKFIFDLYKEKLKVIAIGSV